MKLNPYTYVYILHAYMKEHHGNIAVLFVFFRVYAFSVLDLWQADRMHHLVRSLTSQKNNICRQVVKTLYKAGNIGQAFLMVTNRRIKIIHTLYIYVMNIAWAKMDGISKYILHTCTLFLNRMAARVK